MRTNSQESQIIWREIVGLATQVGEVRGEYRSQYATVTARITRLEDRLMTSQGSDPHHPFTATGQASPTQRISAWVGRALRRMAPMNPLAKFALWLAPKGLLMYGVAMGWSEVALNWLRWLAELI